MLLRRIEVRSFRKLRHLVVDGLAPGLNVLVGDNEAGKSTLLAALRAVLFERHRVGGKVLSAMLPHGSEVRPEILLDFTLAGADWRLRKAFNQRPEAELVGSGGERLAGEAVEDRMAELLGFQAPGNRGSKPDEHQGVYGLLWVDQGLAHGPLNAGAGQGSVSAALESEVGQVLGGERGRLLLARAEERRDSFWDKRDKPRGPWRQLVERVAALEEQRAYLDARLRRHDEQVAALAAKTDILARHTRDDRLTKAAGALAEARRTAARAAELQATLAEIERAHRHAEADRQAAAQRVRDRHDLSDKLEAATLDAARAAGLAQQAQNDLRRAEAALREKASTHAAMRQAREAIETRASDLSRRIARRAAVADLTRLRQTLADAEQATVRRREALAAVAALTVTAADIAALDKLLAARDQARARRDAASAQITFEGTAETHIAVDGAPHPTDRPLLLSSDAVLDLPGFGRLRVRPGGGVEALARALDEADSKLGTQLRAMGQPSPTAATVALARKAEAQAAVAEQDRLLARLAPEGIEALRAKADALVARAGSPEEMDEATQDDDPEALSRQRMGAAQAEATAEAEARAADAAREAAARRAAVLQERASATARVVDSLRTALATARAGIGDERLAGALAEAGRAVELTAQARATAGAALASADPDVATLALRRAEEAEKAIRADIDTLTREKRDLEVELRTLGREGLGEQLSEVEGELDAARKQAAAQTLEAKASLLLHRTLAAAQSETRDRWLGPVRERVRPYLRLIQPGSDLVLNERTFGIEHLVRDGVSEPFDSLSVGAREQVAVITRLALADILRASGQPSAIILDDALVNTDEIRLDRMHLVLQKAAEHLQVLVLTCRERDFLALGAPIHRL